MEYVKTARDIALEKSDLTSDPVLIFLRNQDDQQFNVGDILIRMWRYGDSEWKPEVISSTTDAPKKYLYAFQNELGIGYIKSFKTNGQLSEVSQCITQLINNNSRFILDPEYADHLILGAGEEFKPTNSFKEKKKFRDKAIANTKKLLIPKDINSITTWFNNLKVGDVFYYGYSIPDMVGSQYKVIEMEDVKISSYDSYFGEMIARQLNKSKNDLIRKIKLENLKNRWGASGQFSVVNLTDLFGKSITDKEPFPLTEAQK